MGSPTRPARPTRTAPRRASAVTALALCAALLAPGCGGDAPCARNLLLVTVDTLRADALGVYGYELPTSPNLDRFAEGAVVFENAYAPSTWTLPSVASLMTSHAPSTHRAERTRSVLHGSFETLAERLAARGFRTGAVVSHTFLAPRRGFGQGFQDFDESLIAASAERSQHATSSPQVTDRGLAWLAARAGEDGRWFLWLHYFDPHHVYEEREGLTFRFGEVDREGMQRPDSRDPEAVAAWIEAHRTGARTLYDGEVAFTDRHLGRLLDGLAERGFAHDTLVVIGADHGEEFLDHGAIQHRWNLHDATLRVPLLVRAPGIAPRRVEQRVGLVDVAPTALELLCGVDAPEDAAAGTSLVPALHGRPLARPPIVARLHSLDQDVHEAIVTDGWKLIRTLEGGEVALYDLAADPGEEHDVSAAHPERARALEARLDALMAEQERRAERFGRAAPVRLSPRDLERLRALGYAGAED